MISKSTPSTACTWATVRSVIPEAIGNHFFRPCTDRSGSVAVQAFFKAGAVSGIFQLRARLCHPARGELRFSDPIQHGRVARTSLDPERAARLEGAAWGEVDEVRRQALDGFQGFVALRVQARYRAQQRPGIGMLRMREH